MRPKKKKKRQFRQRFARLLQGIIPEKNGTAPFIGPLESIAILAQEKLGDCILLTPLIRNLRRARPKLEIHLIAFSHASATFFRNDPDVTSVHLAKKQPWRYVREVLSQRFDLLFNTKDHPSTHFLIQSVIIPARFRVGHKNPFHEGLYDRLVDMEYHSHMALKNCALLAVLGIATSREECRPSIPAMPLPDDLKLFLNKLETMATFGINISAGVPNRLWSIDQWTALLARFPDEHFIVLSGPDDTGKKQLLEKSCNNILTSPPTRNLFEAACIVSKLRLLVTPDTSMVHVASAEKTPVVGLYREAPQDISRFGPFDVPFELLISETGQVSDIDVEAVADAIRRLMMPCKAN